MRLPAAALVRMLATSSAASAEKIAVHASVIDGDTLDISADLHIPEVPPAAFDGRLRFKIGNWKAVTPLRFGSASISSFTLVFTSSSTLQC